MTIENLIDTLTNSRAQIRQHIMTTQAGAEANITDYWTVWKERNHLEINTPQEQTKHRHEYLGTYAPKIEAIGSSKQNNYHVASVQAIQKESS